MFWDKTPADAGEATEPVRSSCSARMPARRRSALPIAEASAGMIASRVSVRAADVVFLKGIVEASDGIAMVFAERGGELTLAAPAGRGAEFIELLADFERDLGAQIHPPPEAPGELVARRARVHDEGSLPERRAG